MQQVAIEMQKASIPSDRVNAVRTYLAFFLGYLVDHNSKLSRWQYERSRSSSSLERHAGVAPGVFAETAPQILFDQWLSRVLPSIQACASIPATQDVQLADAGRLPYASGYFDAIVTDPPYYDHIAYSDLGAFYWAWESMILRDITPSALAPTSQGTDGRLGDSISSHGQGLLAAFSEAQRVLKHGKSKPFPVLSLDEASTSDELG